MLVSVQVILANLGIILLVNNHKLVELPLTIEKHLSSYPEQVNAKTNDIIALHLTTNIGVKYSLSQAYSVSM